MYSKHSPLCRLCVACLDAPLVKPDLAVTHTLINLAPSSLTRILLPTISAGKTRSSSIASCTAVRVRLNWGRRELNQSHNQQTSLNGQCQLALAMLALAMLALAMLALAMLALAMLAPAMPSASWLWPCWLWPCPVASWLRPCWLRPCYCPFPSTPPELVSLKVSPSWSQLFLPRALVTFGLGQDPPLRDEHHRPSTELLLQLSYQSHLKVASESM